VLRGVCLCNDALARNLGFKVWIGMDGRVLSWEWGHGWGVGQARQGNDY
jgi:hypothetical protein